MEYTQKTIPRSHFSLHNPSPKNYPLQANYPSWRNPKNWFLISISSIYFSNDDFWIICSRFILSNIFYLSGILGVDFNPPRSPKKGRLQPGRIYFPLFYWIFGCNWIIFPPFELCSSGMLIWFSDVSIKSRKWSFNGSGPNTWRNSSMRGWYHWCELIIVCYMNNFSWMFSTFSTFSTYSSLLVTFSG